MTLTLDAPEIVQTQNAQVTLYSQPGCGPCVGVESALDRMGIPFEKRNIREDSEAYDRMVELGYTGTPVVEHPGGHFKGFDPSEIAKIPVALF